MASISKGKNGHRTIPFVAADGRRRSIRLGKASQRIADNFKVRVEALNAAIISGQAVDAETARWIAALDDVMRDKLARAGLVEPAERATLKAFIDQHVEGRTDLKHLTRIEFNATRRRLVEHFGADRDLRSITPGDADDWRIRMASEGLAENSVRKHVQIAKQFFTAAVRTRLIAENPFADLKSTVRPNPARSYFVTRAEAAAVIEACPDAQWRLLFALSRYGGLRRPSEHLALNGGMRTGNAGA